MLQFLYSCSVFLEKHLQLKFYLSWEIDKIIIQNALANIHIYIYTKHFPLQFMLLICVILETDIFNLSFIYHDSRERDSIIIKNFLKSMLHEYQVGARPIILHMVKRSRPNSRSGFSPLAFVWLWGQDPTSGQDQPISPWWAGDQIQPERMRMIVSWGKSLAEHPSVSSASFKRIL